MKPESFASEVAARYRDQIRGELSSLGKKIRLVGFLSTDQSASLIYSQYTAAGCSDVGIEFELVRSEPENLANLISSANKDNNVNGILVYYPIFGTDKDKDFRQLVSPEKDVEGLNQFWFNKLYNNERFCDEHGGKKAILPCTPLAILKLIEAAHAENSKRTCFEGKTVTIFNRSEVVGAPLAYMIANDGANVFSFDHNNALLIRRSSKEEANISRAEALSKSDIVISGVPNPKFKPILANEVRADSICLNFAEIKNFELDIKNKVSCYIPRIGAVTVAMLLRNTLRLHNNFQRV